MKNIFYKIGRLTLSLSLLAGAASCDDWFTVMPDTAMVAEDFWKDKTDVESELGACYRSMLDGGFVGRLIAWGEVRSDNVLYNNPDKDTQDLMELNIKPTNGYTDWGNFYRTINYCNVLIQKAPQVWANDPDFTEADLKGYMAEAKAIRAFCYFTLVRTFRNVPFITEPYLDDTRDYQVAQTDGDEILRTLLADLRTVEDGATVLFEENLSYTKARVTQKALWTLMADMYLWLGEYGNAVTYCDKVLTTTSNPVQLVKYVNYFNNVFYNGFSHESLWELPFDSNTGNDDMNSFYGGSTNTAPRLIAYGYRDNLFTDRNQDLRYIGSFWRYSGDDEREVINKYVSYRGSVSSSVSTNDFSRGDTRQRHWILYRMADVYLIKAEALACEGNLVDAAEAATEVYDRATQLQGTRTFTTSSQSQLLDEIQDERRREFLFEGKRYFDLMRRLRRTGDIQDIVNNYLSVRYKQMKMEQSVYSSKLSSIAAFYLPINENELKLNTLLEQNEFYKTSNDFSKN